MTSRRERVVGTTRPDASTITERSLESSLWAQNVFRKPVFWPGSMWPIWPSRI